MPSNHAFGKILFDIVVVLGFVCLLFGPTLGMYRFTCMYQFTGAIPFAIATFVVMCGFVLWLMGKNSRVLPLIIYVSGFLLGLCVVGQGVWVLSHDVVFTVVVAFYHRAAY